MIALFCFQYWYRLLFQKLHFHQLNFEGQIFTPKLIFCLIEIETYDIYRDIYRMKFFQRITRLIISTEKPSLFTPLIIIGRL